MEIDGVLQALTEPDLRTAWNSCLSKLVADCEVLGLCVRWVFSRAPRLTRSVTAGPGSPIIESFLNRHPALPKGRGVARCVEWETPMAALELQEFPANVLVSDTKPERALKVVHEIGATAGFRGALAHSYGVLQASFAARKMAVAENSEATLLVDGAGHVHACNEAAAQALGRTGGALEQTDDQRVRFTSRKEDEKFKEGLKAALAEGQARRRILFEDDLLVILGACRMPLGLTGERLVTMTVRTLADPIEVDEGELCAMLQVSPLQVRLAQALLRGESIIAHAETVGCSESTVRWHLARLMDSLGCRKQSDAVLKLSRMCG